MSEALSKVFSALGDPVRRDIVVRLCDGDATLSELAEPFDMSVQAVAKHLAKKQDAGALDRAPQTRELLDFQRVMDLTNVSLALANLISSATPADRDAYTKVINTTYATMVKSLKV